MFKTARYFAYNKHKLRFYCNRIFISFTFHERAFGNHGFYNDTTVKIAFSIGKMLIPKKNVSKKYGENK